VGETEEKIGEGANMWAVCEAVRDVAGCIGKEKSEGVEGRERLREMAVKAVFRHDQ
jgi:hypothetical protein